MIKDNTNPVLSYRSSGTARSKYEMGPTEQRIQIVLTTFTLGSILLLMLFIFACWS